MRVVLLRILQSIAAYCDGGLKVNFAGAGRAPFFCLISSSRSLFAVVFHTQHNTHSHGAAYVYLSNPKELAYWLCRSLVCTDRYFSDFGGFVPRLGSFLELFEFSAYRMYVIYLNVFGVLAV